MGTRIDVTVFNPVIFVVAGAAALLPYSGILDQYLSFIPGVLVHPVEAALGAILAATAVDMAKTESKIDKLWKERFVLAAFLGSLASALLSDPLLGAENPAFDALAGAVAVLASYFSPWHIIS